MVSSAAARRKGRYPVHNRRHPSTARLASRLQTWRPPPRRCTSRRRREPIGRYSFHAKIVPKDHPHAEGYYGQVTALTLRRDGATAHLYHREIDCLPPHGEAAEVIDQLVADLPEICFPPAD